MKILRFDIYSRVLHWSHALVFLWLLITGIALFFTPKSLLGDPFIKMAHLYASLPFILLPLIIYLRGSISIRNDIIELMEWRKDDLHWFIELFKNDKTDVSGKFNAGQKANFLVVLLLIMGFSLTGFLVWMKSMFSRSFVELNFIIHDSLAILSILLLTGHITLALYYSESLKCIIYGKIDAAWAKEHYPNWFLKKN
ncbi:formate dehydrogenase subunit gamma [Methanosarcinales archaeon]|nr:formate dehydrogenase subunit gamma [Methanosarcinales archaeon]